MSQGTAQTGFLDLPVELLELIIDPIIERGWNRIWSLGERFLNLRLVCSVPHLNLLFCLGSSIPADVSYLLFIAGLFDRIVSHCAFRKLDHSELDLSPGRLPNDNVMAWWLMHQLFRRIKEGTAPDGLTKAVSCAVQATAQWNLGSSAGEENYWKAACIVVVAYKGKVWVAEQLRAASSKVPNTSFYMAGHQRHYDLLMAAYYDDKSVVEKILKDGISVNFSDEYLGNALHAAVYRGNTDMIQLLLDNGADVNSGCGNSPLLAAAIKGHKEAVRVLLKQRDIDINFENSQNQTPLLVASQKGHTEVVRLLLEENGIDINFHNGDGRTPLCEAVFVGNEDVVHLLLKRSDIQPNIRILFPRPFLDWFTGFTPLYYAVVARQTGIVRILLRYPAVDLNVRDRWQKTLLHAAVHSADDRIVRMVLERGVEVDPCDMDGRTPLSYASEGGYITIVQLLLEQNGVNIHLEDRYGCSPLWYAMEHQHPAVTQLFLEKARSSD
ncbi:hypothetical protein VTN77DRAFT_3949 [Rasamsonia byssochlamydoides]|uniref:uncharacterized protein n=1 Tax=Rasamsonia byssochlamydoides TaxID=89139 RepID=UPI00374275A8